MAKPHKNTTWCILVQLQSVSKIVNQNDQKKMQKKFGTTLCLYDVLFQHIRSVSGRVHFTLDPLRKLHVCGGQSLGEFLFDGESRSGGGHFDGDVTDVGDIGVDLK